MTVLDRFKVTRTEKLTRGCFANMLLLRLKGTVMQIEKALMNDRLRVSKEPWKFGIPTIYDFAVI